MNESPFNESIAEPLWESVTPQQFEYFTYILIRAMSFEQVQMRSGPGDSGEDIIGYQPSIHPGIAPISRKWVFQCKRTKKLARAKILGEISHFAGQSIDSWVLVTTAVPTTNFRRWFEKLSKSHYAPFYVQAWWRMDINLFVREYRSFLLQNLPPDIIQKLRLFEYLKYSTPPALDNIIAKCRSFTNAQVRRFGRSKYIKGLYVHRKLQGYLSGFHSTEAKLAKRLKTYCIGAIAQHTLKLSEILRSFASIKSALEDLPGEHRPAEVEQMIRQLQNLFNKILDSFKPLLSRAQSLSDVDIHNQKSSHKVMTEAILETLLSIKEAKETSEQQKTFDEILKNSKASVERLSGKYLKRIAPLLQDSAKLVTAMSTSGFANMISSLEDVLSEIERVLWPCVVVIDRAGGGKTSLLCELALNLSTESPTILLFGKENFQHPESLVRRTQQIIAEALEPTATDPIKTLDEILEPEGLFLNVFTDGINESRRIPELDLALIAFLEWAKCHRIRVTISCRDIYWSFFDYEKWRHLVYAVRENELYQFSPDEYEKALPLYLEHFRMKCKLAETAREACKHPLLLRFFCEAYGNPDGDLVSLGPIRDIRLKELFDTYYNRKVDQIRYFLRHRNADLASRFLLDLVWHMYRKTSTTLLTDEIEEATGHSDTSTQDSMYLRFLDEDIIIEEEPTDQVESRCIYFVYEEFMEYVLAKCFLSRYHKSDDEEVCKMFGQLKAVVDDWVNARGVAEYMALMLLGAESSADLDEGLKLLNEMVLSGGVWVDAFWSVVGKYPESAIDSRLFDLFYPALSVTDRKWEVKKALLAMSRYNEKAAGALGAALLWSATLPNVLRWSDIERLSDMDQAELDDLAARIGTSHRNQTRYDYLKGVHCGHLLEWILPHVERSAGDRIRESLKLRGKPSKTGFIVLMHIVRDLFPEKQVYILNGLFHVDDAVVSFCADRIRFVKSERPAVAFLCEKLAAVEERKHIRDILLDSAHWINEAM